MVVNDDWRVVRYDKANINLKKGSDKYEQSQSDNPAYYHSRLYRADL